MRAVLLGLLLLLSGFLLPSCQNSPQTGSAPPPPPAAETGAKTAPATPSTQKSESKPTEKSKVTDWIAFRGPNADGISPETGINKSWSSSPPRLLWKQNLSDGGFAGPSSAHGLVYIIDHQGNEDVIRAFDLQSGQERWRYSYEDASGDNYGYARSTPAIDGETLYAVSRMGKLICLEALTGKLLWQKDLIAEFGGRLPSWEMAVSPVIDGDRLIVVPGGNNASVVALNKKDGQVIWKGGGSEAPGYATPVVAVINGKKQYVCFLARSVVGVDAENGQVIWRHPWRTSYDVNAATPLVMGDSVFITSGYGTGCAMLDIQGGRVSVRWQHREMKSRFSSPIYYDGHIYGTTEPGELLCIDPSSGRVLWQQRGFEWGGLMGVDGALIVMNGAEGDVVLVERSPAAYRELGRIKPLGGRSWTAPILSRGKLIVRNNNAIACLELKK
jgi:outer membrane protein assembly factor BamB